MKYYLIAGEASGDLHGSNLMKEISKLDAHAKFRCWGGDKMREAGGDMVMHYKDTAFMGFAEVAKNIGTIFKLLKKCKDDILQYKPDALILIDYPGFNLRIAGFAHENKIKVFFYISPQLWAWKASRVKIIKASVDKMFVILPFEKEFYKKYDYEVDYVGHPLLDAIAAMHSSDGFLKKNNLTTEPLIALLPGSRKQEIAKMLPVMEKMKNEFPQYQFVITGLSVNGKEFYTDMVGNYIPVVYDQTYQLLAHSYAALVTSGTATLETALFQVPQVVCYKGSPVSYFIGKRLVDVKYIALVNLIMDKPVVKELIQNDFNIRNLNTELRKITEDEKYRSAIIADYKLLREKLGGTGASKRTAELITRYIK
jgi:lipid-A-disaccharide synthase